MRTSWCNGQWSETAGGQPTLTDDRAWTVGLGLFETLLAVDGRLPFVERHLERLGKACGQLGWAAPHETIPELPALLAECVARNPGVLARARVRLTMTAGSGPLDDLRPGADQRVWITAAPAQAAIAPLAVALSPWPRNERGALAGLKCSSYAENLVALDHARREGCAETLFFNTAGRLCEAATANVFVAGTDGVWRTPPLSSGCLPGIARAVLLDLAAAAGLRCEEGDLTHDDLERATEIVLTSAVRGPVAVCRLGTRALAPGPLTARMHALWQSALLPPRR